MAESQAVGLWTEQRSAIERSLIGRSFLSGECLLRFKLLVLSTVGISACSGGSGPAPALPPAPVSVDDDYQAATVRAAATILPDEVRRHITYLASDELAGRDTPSPGLEAAASYLIESLEAAGLAPAGENGTFVQRFPYTRTAMIAASRQVNYTLAGSTHELEYAREYYLIPGQRSATNAEVVYAGEAGQPSSGVAQIAQGKVVIFSATGNPIIGAGEELLNAFQTAAQGGASAVILLLDETQVPDTIMEMASALQGAGLVTPLPIVGLSTESGAALLAEAGMDLVALRASPPANATLLSRVTMNVSAPYEVSEHTPPNVVAMVRGSDPELQNEYIVYSAHFDHVGVGIPDRSADSIYNGADDNASGTAVLLETAAAFAALDVPPARSVIFLAVSGEEKGLLGSKHYSENPTVPIGDVIMNINLDMVGRNHPDTVIGIGRQYTNLGPLTDRILREHPDIGFTVIEDPKPEEQGFFRSDHLHFVNKDIPAIFFSAGFDHEDYHKPSDEVALIDADKAARVGRLVFHLGALIASGTVDPEWTEDGLREVRQIIAENAN
jgi:hypothetical protein